MTLPYVARPSSLVRRYQRAVYGRQRGDARRSAAVPSGAGALRGAQLELLRKDKDASDRQMQKFLGYVQRFIQQKRQPAGQTIRPARSYFGRSHDKRLGMI